MPNLDPKDIIKLNDYLKNKKCDIGTLASNFKNQDEHQDKNVVKVITKKILKIQIFLRLLILKEQVDKEKNTSIIILEFMALLIEANKICKLKKKQVRNEQMRAK